MDLLELEVVREAVQVPLKHPSTEEPIFSPRLDADGNPVLNDEGEEIQDPVYILVYGRDSKPYKERQRYLIDKRIEAASKKGTPKKITAITVEEEGKRTLLACLAGWSPNLMFDKKPLPFNEGNARMLLSRLEWIEEQLDNSIMDRGLFMKA